VNKEAQRSRTVFPFLVADAMVDGDD